ncbi:MAG: DNA polymerase III subunit alpha [Anaerolineae bacterium]|nr:DNA polymerase III subunit alpha [Anaerolineae bacterium]
MQIVTEIGLLKVDFLGLATLTVMQRAAVLIEKHHGVTFNLATIPTDDPDAFKLLASGAVQGVFQVEGPGMRRILQENKPTRLEHIIALVALYRPGPLEYIPNYIRRMHGEEEIKYKAPQLEPILKETYGIFVYQEQLMRTAMDLAGYTATDADKLRKAVAKKKKDDLLKQREKFVGGGVKKGLNERLLNEIFDDFEAFARYGFPKGHAADYAVVTVQTAYLKSKYPVEYITALLSVSCGDTDKASGYVADATALGIKILPPSINWSGIDFGMEKLPAHEVKGKITHDVGIRFGLAAVKNVGEGPVQTIITARGEKPFASLDDFARRVDLRQVNRRALECLVKAGAFDEFGHRNQLLQAVDSMVSLSAEHHRAQDVGQMSLFGGLMGPTPASGGFALNTLALPRADEPSAKEMLSWEKDLLGCFLGEHPLHRLAQTLDSKITHSLNDLDPSLKGQPVVIAGMINSIRVRQTKKGDPFAFITIEDLGGQVDVTLFPRVYEGVKALLTTDTLVLVRGKVDTYNDKANVLADEVREYSLDAVANVEPVALNEVDWSRVEAVDNFFPSAPPEWTGDEAAEAAPDFAPAPASEMPAAPPLTLRPPTVEAVAPARPEPATPARVSESPAPAYAKPVVAPSTPPPTTPPATVAEEPDLAADLVYHLEITLPRSGNNEDDIRRLGEIHKLVSGYAGHDTFSVIVPRGSARVQIDFPNDKTKCNKLLIKQLEQRLGSHSVRVINKTPPDAREKWRKQAGT